MRGRRVACIWCLVPRAQRHSARCLKLADHSLGSMQQLVWMHEQEAEYEWHSTVEEERAQPASRLVQPKCSDGASDEQPPCNTPDHRTLPGERTRHRGGRHTNDEIEHTCNIASWWHPLTHGNEVLMRGDEAHHSKRQWNH